MRKHELVYALNAGAVDPEAVARTDLEKMRLAGEHPVTNLFPRVLGPATLRPGTESLTPIPDDAETHQIKFLRSIGNGYVLLFTDAEMRITLDGVIQQVPEVATTVSATGWTDASTSPGTASVPGRPIGLLLTLTDPRSYMIADSAGSARMRQTVTVAAPDQATAHVLRVVVERGVVFLRIGTTSGGDELLTDAELDTGTHKISFTPNTGTIYIELRADDANVIRLVSTIQFESTLIGGTGDLVIPTPWTIDEARSLRWWQSIDTLFLGDGTHQQRRIEHRGPLSWGISIYKTDDGPFVSGSNRVGMTPMALTGNTTVTASEATFKAGHVGSLLELTQTSKTVTRTINAADQTSDYVTIIGVDAGRYFYRTGVGSAFVGTIVLERSFDEADPVSWTTFASYTDGAATFARVAVDDTLDNLTVHYRYRCTAYTSGSSVMTLEYESGVQTARARIVEVTSATTANVETIVPFGNTSVTRNWRSGDWSDVRGWPRTPIIHDSRLHWFRQDTHYGSEPDNYYTFDDGIEGDSMPFTRSVGSGGEEGVVWALSQNRLLTGTPAFEAVIAASELDEPLTATRYTVRKTSRRGCADIQAVDHDDGGFFVQRSGRRLYEISIGESGNRFQTNDISRLNPAAYRPGIVRLAVQQQPDTRLYAVLEDGTVSVLTYERDDKVVAITTLEVSGGLVEDIEILPNTDQDDVYLIVNRDGSRYQERLAKEADQNSVSTCGLLDGHKVLTDVTAITGGTHFAEETVAVWADGQRRDDVTLDSDGEAELGALYSRVVYGLPYTAEFRSVKLAYAAQLGSAIGQTKTVHGAGVILAHSCMDGVEVGTNTEDGVVTYDPLPAIINGAARTTNQFFTHYDSDVLPLNGAWSADSRVYLRIDSAEGPCTVQAVVIDVETRDGSETGSG